jgi:hypothetical protein
MQHLLKGHGMNTSAKSVWLVPRCLVWVIAKLPHVWDIQIELTGSVIGGGSEVDEVSKPARHSFG